MTEWQVMLNGGIGVASLVVVLIVFRSNAEMMKTFMASVIEEMKETTNAVKELTAEVRTGRK